MKKLAAFTLLAVPLFLISQKVGIECKQSGFEIAGYGFITSALVNWNCCLE